MVKVNWKKIQLGTLKELKILLPIFFAASVIAVLIEGYLPDGMFDFVVGML